MKRSFWHCLIFLKSSYSILKLCFDLFLKTAGKYTKAFLFHKPKIKNIFIKKISFFAELKILLIFKDMRLFITIIFTASLTFISAQNKLQYNLNVDDTFTVSQEAKQEITQEISGEKQIINNDLVGSMFFKVIKADTDFITFEMSFTKMKMLMSSPSMGELMNMDTSSESEDMMTKMIKGILNYPVTIKMHRNGKIESVLGGEKLIENMFVSAEITQPEIIESAKGQMEKQFGTEALTNSFEQITYIFSDKVVNVKDTWSNEYQGEVSVINSWTLESMDDTTFYITGKAETTLSTKKESISMNLSGSQTTSAKGSVKTGLVTELIVSGENKGISEMSSFKIPTTIKSTITYKISQ